MRYRILGPLEVFDDEGPVDTGPHKQRSLLALLLIHANRVVPTDRILDELWGEDAEGKENSLWVYVSRLRSALEPGLKDASAATILTTRDHGYALNVAEETIDAIAFERAVADGRELLTTDPQAASAVLHEALDWWRGDALQDFTYDEFAQTEIVRLGELRLAATEDAFDADLRSGKSGELVSGLEALQDDNPLRERPVALLMLALYRAGRSADALRAFERFRRSIGEELGIAPSPELGRLEEQILVHDSRLQLQTPGKAQVPISAVNPFKGLRPFREDDAPDFFGRDRLVAEVLRRITDDERLLALIGPSGSGKSSAVMAGLIPAIRKGDVTGSGNWLVAHMLPGSDPFIELEAALMRASLDAPDRLAETVTDDDERGLLRAAVRVLPDENSRMILVIDQFEEMFTLVADEPVRRRFIDQIVTSLDDPYGRVIVVLTLRSDFYSQAFGFPELAARMAAGVINVVPLSSDELEDAALGPARASGVAVEPALLVELLADIIGQPGGLPLFQYTLTELFDRRVDDVLSIDTYRSIGGARGALTRRADELFDGLDRAEQQAAQQLFLRLVTIVATEEWSRRRVPASEIVSLDVDLVAMQAVIERFTTHRLLSLDRDQTSGAPTVEVAHDALLSEWGRLRLWIEQNREDLLRHRQLAIAASVWDEAGRDPDYVYTGGRLDDAVAWTETSSIKLTERERQFLDAGVHRQATEREAVEEIARREHRLRRSARRRTWGLASALAVLVALGAAVLFIATRPEGPKVALVHGGVSVIQDLIEEGWNRADRELEMSGARVESLVDEEADVRSLAESGYGLIIDGLFDDGQVAYELADDYPEVSFVVFDGSDTSLENVTALDFVREGGAYLMGVAAALASETGHIGFIGGWQQETTEARRASYSAGARAINPEIHVDSVYLGPYLDALNGPYLDYGVAKQTAAEMYRSGVDVIHHSAGEAGLAIPAAAAELMDEMGRPLWVIGSEVDEQRVVPADQADRFLTSMWKRWDSAVYEVVRAYLAGELEPGVHELDLASGSVDYSREGLTPEQLATLDQIETGIVEGTIDPNAPELRPPRWTRPSDVIGVVVFDGTSCTSSVSTTNLNVGDVLEIDIINNSHVDVRLRISSPDNGSRPVTTAQIAPAWRNAAAMRVLEGTYVVDCLDEGTVDQAASFLVTYDTRCDLPVEATSPEAVVRELASAMTARNRDHVCSLFADDAVLNAPFEDEPLVGNAAIAELITPFDDDNWFQEYAITDLDVVDDTVVWSSEYRSAFGDVLASRDHRTAIEEGRIARWDFGSADDG